MHSRTWNLLVGSFHPTLIISGAWVIGGHALSICEGDAISNSLFFIVGIILVIGFGLAMAGKLNNLMDLLIRRYYFSGKEGTPQGLVLLNCFLSLDLQGPQVSLEVKDQVEFNGVQPQ